VEECLESRSLVEKDWEVAKHNLQGPGFEELRPQIAKPTSVTLLARRGDDDAHCFMDKYKASQERRGN